MMGPHCCTVVTPPTRKTTAGTNKSRPSSSSSTWGFRNPWNQNNKRNNNTLRNDSINTATTNNKEEEETKNGIHDSHKYNPALHSSSIYNHHVPQTPREGENDWNHPADDIVTPSLTVSTTASLTPLSATTTTAAYHNNTSPTTTPFSSSSSEAPPRRRPIPKPLIAKYDDDHHSGDHDLRPSWQHSPTTMTPTTTPVVQAPGGNGGGAAISTASSSVDGTASKLGGGVGGVTTSVVEDPSTLSMGHEGEDDDDSEVDEDDDDDVDSEDHKTTSTTTLFGVDAEQWIPTVLVPTLVWTWNHYAWPLLLWSLKVSCQVGLLTVWGPVLCSWWSARHEQININTTSAMVSSAAHHVLYWNLGLKLIHAMVVQQQQQQRRRRQQQSKSDPEASSASSSSIRFSLSSSWTHVLFLALIRLGLEGLLLPLVAEYSSSSPDNSSVMLIPHIHRSLILAWSFSDVLYFTHLTARDFYDAGFFLLTFLFLGPAAAAASLTSTEEATTVPSSPTATTPEGMPSTPEESTPLITEEPQTPSVAVQVQDEPQPPQSTRETVVSTSGTARSSRHSVTSGQSRSSSGASRSSSSRRSGSTRRRKQRRLLNSQSSPVSSRWGQKYTWMVQDILCSFLFPLCIAVHEMTLIAATARLVPRPLELWIAFLGWPLAFYPTVFRRTLVALEGMVQTLRTKIRESRNQTTRQQAQAPSSPEPSGTAAPALSTAAPSTPTRTTAAGTSVAAAAATTATDPSRGQQSLWADSLERLYLFGCNTVLLLAWARVGGVLVQQYLVLTQGFTATTSTNPTKHFTETLSELWQSPATPPSSASSSYDWWTSTNTFLQSIGVSQAASAAAQMCWTSGNLNAELSSSLSFSAASAGTAPPSFATLVETALTCSLILEVLNAIISWTRYANVTAHPNQPRRRPKLQVLLLLAAFRMALQQGIITPLLEKTTTMMMMTTTTTTSSNQTLVSGIWLLYLWTVSCWSMGDSIRFACFIWNDVSEWLVWSLDFKKRRMGPKPRSSSSTTPTKPKRKSRSSNHSCSGNSSVYSATAEEASSTPGGGGGGEDNQSAGGASGMPPEEVEEETAEDNPNPMMMMTMMNTSHYYSADDGSVLSMWSSPSTTSTARRRRRRREEYDAEEPRRHALTRRMQALSKQCRGTIISVALYFLKQSILYTPWIRYTFLEPLLFPMTALGEWCLLAAAATTAQRPLELWLVAVVVPLFGFYPLWKLLWQQRRHYVLAMQQYQWQQRLLQQQKAASQQQQQQHRSASAAARGSSVASVSSQRRVGEGGGCASSTTSSRGIKHSSTPTKRNLPSVASNKSSSPSPQSDRSVSSHNSSSQRPKPVAAASTSVSPPSPRTRTTPTEMPAEQSNPNTDKKGPTATTANKKKSIFWSPFFSYSSKTATTAVPASSSSTSRVSPSKIVEGTNEEEEEEEDGTTVFSSTCGSVPGGSADKEEVVKLSSPVLTQEDSTCTTSTASTNPNQHSNHQGGGSDGNVDEAKEENATESNVAADAASTPLPSMMSPVNIKSGSTTPWALFREEQHEETTTTTTTTTTKKVRTMGAAPFTPTPTKHQQHSSFPSPFSMMGSSMGLPWDSPLAADTTTMSVATGKGLDATPPPPPPTQQSSSTTSSSRTSRTSSAGHSPSLFGGRKQQAGLSNAVPGGEDESMATTSAATTALHGNHKNENDNES